MGRAGAIAVVCLVAATSVSGAGSRPRRGSARAAAARAAVLVLPEPPSARDLAIGEAARRALGRAAGSVVAMDPATGRVMAVVNPALGIERAYSPCSVFKIVVAIAGLSEGAITPDTPYDCQAGCWLWPGHGPLDLRRALANSCNPYFQWVGQTVGYPTVRHYAQLLGLGEPTGINLAREARGTLPPTVPLYRVGYVSSHAAGIATTAMQLGVLLSATVNGGRVLQPRLAPAAGFVPHERWQLPAAVRTAGLRDGFLSAVNEGSAKDALVSEVAVGGKTGTCSGAGWFASVAPLDEPEMVVVVFVRPGSGHAASAVAGRMYRELYGAPLVVEAPRAATDHPAGGR